MSCPTCNASRFYIIDSQNGDVRGTNDEEIANKYSSQEYFCVIDTWENKNICVFTTKHIEEAK